MITDAKISSAAKISPAKIAPAQVGQLMVAQADGKYAPVTISGDANLAEDGKLRLKNLDEITERALAKAGEYFNRNEEALKRSDLKKGKTLVGGATTPVEVPVGTGSNAIPQRDSSGNLKAETADQATNADDATLLNSQNAAYYTNVDNHVYPDQATTTTNGDQTTTTSSAPKVIEFVPNTSNYPAEFSHTFGYIPDVTVFKVVSAGTYEMIDAEVTASTSNVSVDVSDRGISTRIVAK